MKKLFPLRIVLSLVLAFGAVGGVVVANAVLDTADDEQAAGTTGETRPTTTTQPPTTTTTLPPWTLIQPAYADMPDVPPTGWGLGSRDAIITYYEQRLKDLKFDPGDVDGYFDQATVYAMHAIEKLAGLPRVGRLGPAEAAYIETFQYSTPLHQTAEPNRTEIDITRQIITVYQFWQPQLITTTSTASGEEFCYNTPRRAPTTRVCEVATTPSGRYDYYFFYDGWHKGDLGSLYNPFYFFKGRAVHGYEDVPPEPASHGCARIPMHIAEYFYKMVAHGEAVYVDGGSNGEMILSSTPIGGGSAPPSTAPPTTATTSAPAPPPPPPPSP